MKIEEVMERSRGTPVNGESPFVRKPNGVTGDNR